MYYETSFKESRKQLVSLKIKNLQRKGFCLQIDIITIV